MTRVWLSGWEWACCGDTFRVGDAVDFGVAPRGVAHSLAELVGSPLSGTVDAVESHHEENFPDRIRGVVRAIDVVEVEHIERRELRRPGFGAPPDAVMPPPGEQWPFTGRRLGNGFSVGNRPSPYVVVSESVGGSARTRPVEGVRIHDDPERTTADDGDCAADPPPERRVRRSPGWIVDVDED